MKIGIDVRLWNETGVGRYTRNLVKNLAKIDKKNEYVLFAKSSDTSSIKSIIKGEMSIVETDIAWHTLSEQINFPKLLNRENLDLVHFPYFSVPLFYNKPYVVTVHDLIVNKFSTGRASTLPLPLYYAKRVGYNAVLANAVYRSRKIITPTNAVKQDLLRTYRGIKPSKVEVTSEGGMENLKLKTQNEPLVEGKYLLRVGNFYPHKNVERLLIALHDLVYENYDNHSLKLVLVGHRDFFFKKIEKLIETLNIGANVIFFEDAKDDELVNLYLNATATVVPSLSEGFSLTALEAQGLGCPVIASDIAAHREVLGDAAIFFNPGKLPDIKQKINFILTLVEKSRDDLIVGGRKNAKKYSWGKMGEETLAVYNSQIVSNNIE